MARSSRDKEPLSTLRFALQLQNFSTAGDGLYQTVGPVENSPKLPWLGRQIDHDAKTAEQKKYRASLAVQLGGTAWRYLDGSVHISRLKGCSSTVPCIDG